MSGILVVHYSLGGATHRVADEIAEALSADAHAIADATERRGWLGYLRSGFESAARGLPSIRTDFAPAEYRLVVLGAPVWWGSMASPMRSFLFLHAHELLQVACFCTTGSRGAERTLHEMKSLCGEPNAPAFWATEADVRKRRHTERLHEYIDALEELAGAFGRIRTAEETGIPPIRPGTS